MPEAIGRGELVAAVATAEDTERAEKQGAVHTSTVADIIDASIEPVRDHLQELATDGVLSECYDIGPTGPRLCFRVADPEATEDDHGRRKYV